MRSSPYSGLPPSRFWKSAVADPDAREPLHVPKFPIGMHTKIATAGSCFAQHLHRYLRASGLEVLDLERPPPGLGDANALRYGFGMFSARYGNIYLARQLLQLAREALGDFEPADAVWERDGRYFDALRPAVEPAGFATPDEVRTNRHSHLLQVRRLLRRAEVFVFTFGLTEAWLHTQSGTVFPTAPGTLAGSYDPARYSFHNFSCEEVRTDFLQFRELVRRRNPGVRFLLTVSPVPLTATASQQHVLRATMHSKAVLRAAAGQLAAECEDVDYFPSFEIIANPWTQGRYFEANLRSVTAEGVALVMRTFCETYGLTAAAASQTAKPDNDDIPCEDAMLEAFGR